MIKDGGGREGKGRREEGGGVRVRNLLIMALLIPSVHVRLSLFSIHHKYSPLSRKVRLERAGREEVAGRRVRKGWVGLRVAESDQNASCLFRCLWFTRERFMDIAGLYVS